MVLESYLRARLEKRDLLLMTHIVVGYPSFEDCFRIIEAMVRVGVDLMELQIPFSEPIADGPVILRANQEALEKGTTVRKCLDFVQRVTRSFPIPFLVMTYYNIIFRYGVGRFVSEMAAKGLHGAIVPDLPPEEGGEFLSAMETHALAPIFTFSPTTHDDRMRYIASLARGFIYCIARKGVTGANTAFSKEMERYLARCRKATHLPLALGFGVKEKTDMDFLRGKVDMAVIGSEMLRVLERDGVDAIEGFIRSLRNP